MSENPVRKVALLIGVGEYGEGLPPLQCPAKGVEAMQDVLGNADIGGFEVVPSVNPDVGEMRALISDTFAPLRKNDLALLYFTGHGIKTITDDFYLTTAQTKLFKNGQLSTGTAIEAEFVKQVLRDCNAARKVVILDCCFGAAFVDGFLTMDDGSMNVETQMGGKGWCVLTAATSRRYALEQVGEELSVYTRYLVEGLKTGGAALDGWKFVSVRHWHDYVEAQIRTAAPAMEPAIFNGQAGENIYVAKAQVDNTQRYRKQVQKRIRNGRISAAARTELVEYWQKQMAITSELAKQIEDEILKPYREKERHLALYAKALETERKVAYPFDNGVIQDFKDLQKAFGLTDEDVKGKEIQVLGKQLQPRINVPSFENTDTLERPSNSSIEGASENNEVLDRQPEEFTPEEFTSEVENQTPDINTSNSNLDIEQGIYLSSVEMKSGIKKIINLGSEKIVVSIPPDIRPKQKLRIKGKGMLSDNQAVRGNLYLRIEPFPKIGAFRSETSPTTGTFADIFESFFKGFSESSNQKNINEEQKYSTQQQGNVAVESGRTEEALGVEILGGIMNVIVPPHTFLPVKSEEIYSTAVDGQTNVEINILKGNEELAKDNESLGTFRLDGIPPAAKGVPQIRVTFEIGETGQLFVSARDQGSGREISVNLLK
ncbi:MAG: Hsp70 family protein [Phormidesmis sp.]